MTMKELAKLAGVSPAAVSRYLNGGPLSAEKRRVIRAAIERTGYQPDPAAQTLRTRSTDIVGLIVPKLDSESMSRLAAGASEVLDEAGFACQLGVSGNDPKKELAFLQLFQNRPAAGVILMGTVLTPELERFLQSTGMPVVVAGQNFKGVPCVYHDDYGAALELTRLVLSKGRRRLAYIGAIEQDAAAGEARRRGVQAGLREAGLDPELPVEISSFEVEGGRAAMERLLERCPELDAVLCATDRMAFGAMQALREAGKRLPQDVAVTGIGDSWAGEHVEPHLTTARFYYKTCGESAARLLIDRINDKDRSAPMQQVVLSYTIQQRDSV
ncbi:MAG: LacI family DNA-binding transcriptional regulator [Oscillospiraceae bacterium]|nr:LacI family DNA-binding transcriptional regulator [Oscillospiraceae bacterium]